MRIRNSSLGAAVVFLAAAKVLAQDTRPNTNDAVERDLRDLARRDRATLQSCYAAAEQSHAHAWRSVTDVQVAVRADGAVGHVTVRGAADVANSLEACVNRVTANWQLRNAPSAAALVMLSRDRIRAAYQSMRQ